MEKCLRLFLTTSNNNNAFFHISCNIYRIFWISIGNGNWQRCLSPLSMIGDDADDSFTKKCHPDTYNMYNFLIYSFHLISETFFRVSIFPLTSPKIIFFFHIMPNTHYSAFNITRAHSKKNKKEQNSVLSNGIMSTKSPKESEED